MDLNGRSDGSITESYVIFSIEVNNMGFFNGIARMFTLPKKGNSVRDVVGDKVADVIKPVIEPILTANVTTALDGAFNSLYNTARLQGAPEVVLDKMIAVYPEVKREFLKRCKI
jgi:hypothetical protein